MNRWFGYDISAEESFKMIKATGFDNVLLWWGDEFDHQIGKKELMPDMARAEGLYIENVHMTFARANALWENSDETETAVNEYISCIKSCGQYDIPTMVVHLSKGMNPPEISEHGIENIKKLIGYAEKHNVNFAIENIERNDYTEYILENVKSDKLKLCYDSGHDKCFIDSGFLEKHADKIVTLHLHDNDGTSDHHMIPGDSDINWTKIVKSLNKANYKGAITLECANNGHDIYKGIGPEEFLEKAYQSAKKLVTMMESEL